MKKPSIDKTNKSDVILNRKTSERFSGNKELLKELYGREININSLSNFEQEYECWECNKKIKYYDEPNERVFCEECRKKHVENYNNLLKEQSKIKSEIMLEKAMQIIENSKSYAHEYKDSYIRIKQLITDNCSLFRSSEEVVVALVLDNFHYDYEVNYKINKYVVDFYIPEEKLCLEVDGERHKYNTQYDKKRDMVIREDLGSEWEVVRIPTKYISFYPDKIPEAMLKLKNEMQKSRQNYGIISDNFSRREQDYYGSILELQRYRKEKEQYNTIKKYFEDKKNTKVPKSS